mmetsp:Transcript_90875/g.282701  ORF Transcript_90875/g.282701 Transcript_90875/m.282701 type:complete len:394 (-) Transcript_90875:76-1257(-)
MVVAMTDSGLTLLATFAMCCTSLGCLIGGVVYLGLATEEQREHLTADYERAVREWPEALRDFEGLEPLARLRGTSVTLAANSTPDTLHDAEGPLPAYEALRYRTGLPREALPGVELGDMELRPRRSPVEHQWAEGPAVSVTLNISGSLLTTEALPLVRAESHAEPGGLHNHCGQRRGVTIGGACWAFSRLARLCVQVERANQSSWQLAARAQGRNASYGCDFAGGKWLVPVYRRLDIDRGRQQEHEQWPSGAVDFDDVVLEVRSRFDPYLTALELTHGTLRFGMSAEEEDLLGVVLIVMGVAFSCPLWCALGRRWRRNRRSSKPGRRRVPMNWKSREPDPETLGMRYAMDVADSQRAAACGLESAINHASTLQDGGLRPAGRGSAGGARVPRP